MTRTALTSNHEWNTRVISTKNGELAQNILDEFNVGYDETTVDILAVISLVISYYSSYFSLAKSSMNEYRNSLYNRLIAPLLLSLYYIVITVNAAWILYDSGWSFDAFYEPHLMVILPITILPFVFLLGLKVQDS